MAAMDYGVITLKNGILMDETIESEDNNGFIVEQGDWGRFRHGKSGIVFYRLMIRNNIDIDTADFIVGLNPSHVKSFNYDGIEFKCEKLFEQTYKTTFTDNAGDEYIVIHGYDVCMDIDDCISRSRFNTYAKYTK